MKYIFYHLPKTGGQSINLSFRKHLVYHKTFIHLGYHGEKAARELGLAPWRDRTLVQRDMAFFIMGHKVDLNTKNYFGIGREAKEMILFREPALHLVSLYNFKYRHKENPPSFFTWYTLLKIKGGKNWQATNFFRHYLKKSYLKSYFLKNLDYFKIILDDFWFVGVTENINYDFQKIAFNMGIEQFIMERTNVSGEKTLKHIEITQKLRDKLNNENELDFNLYIYAKNRNNQFH
jgi:hypothetical protein